MRAFELIAKIQPSEHKHNEHRGTSDVRCSAAQFTEWTEVGNMINNEATHAGPQFLNFEAKHVLAVSPTHRSFETESEGSHEEEFGSE